MAHGAKDSYLAQVVKLVKDAQNAKSNTQLLADKAAQWLTGIAILAGVVTFIYWYVDGKTLAFAMGRMVTVISAKNGLLKPEVLRPMVSQPGALTLLKVLR